MSSLGAATGRPDELKTIAQVALEDLGRTNPEYFTVKATIVHIKQENFAYPACPGEKCNKKMTDMGDSWRCDKCEVNHDRPQYRYIMSIDISDHTGHMWLSCFDESGRTIMGKSADELMDLQTADPVSFAEAFETANCRKLQIRCRAKADTYNDSERYVLFLSLTLRERMLTMTLGSDFKS
jgi:replication factor A1